MEFFWDLPKYLEWTKYPWHQYSTVNRFLICVVQDLSNWWVLGITSWMELWKSHHQTQHVIGVIHDQFLGWEPEPLSLHKMVRDQDRSLYMSGVTTWVRQICCLVIFHPRYRLNSPICCAFWELCLLLYLQKSPC